MINVYRGNRTGNIANDRVPYVAYEDEPGELLNREQALEAVLAQALIDQGVPVTDFSYEKESPQYYEIDALYSDTRPSVLTLEPVGNAEIGFRYQAESELIKHSLSTVDSGGIDGDWAPLFGNLVGVEGGQWGNNLRHTGIQVLPRVTNWIRYTVARSFMTESYETAVGDVMGHVNTAAYRGKPPGTLRFVSCSSTIRSDDDMQITYGFDYRPVVAESTIPAVDYQGSQTTMTVPAYDGHDKFWTYDEVYVDDSYDGPLPAPARTEVLSKQAMFWYIERVHPRSDIAAVLGI